MDAQNEGGWRAGGADVIRVLIALGWLAGAVFNATYTVRHPEMLVALFKRSPLPLYHWLFDNVARPHLTLWTWMAVVGEVAIGLLMLGRGIRARLGLLGSTLWSAFLSLLCWPYTLMMGPYTVLNAWLLRRNYERNLPDILYPIVRSV